VPLEVGDALGVIEDALPDDWGRALIIRRRQLHRAQQSASFLLQELAEHGAGLGAIMFARGREKPPVRAVGRKFDLATLAEAAKRFEAGLEADPEGLQMLFAAGSSLGGARPKALVSDATGEWIANSPSVQRDGRFDMVGLEAVELDLAERAGIDVPAHDLHGLGNTAQRALLVERFDVVGATGRRHMISLKTLCRERPGAYALTCTELAEVVRKVTAKPQDNVQRLYQQMVFNAALGNTDDHLKNFWLVHDAGGYRLSKAFDPVPDVGGRREHTMAFEYERGAPTCSELLRLAKRWNVPTAENLIDAVVTSVDDFAAVAAARGVPPSNIAEVGADIARRARRLAPRQRQRSPAPGGQLPG